MQKGNIFCWSCLFSKENTSSKLNIRTAAGTATKVKLNKNLVEKLEEKKANKNRGKKHKFKKGAN